MSEDGSNSNGSQEGNPKLTNISLSAARRAKRDGGDRTSMACLQCQHSHVTCSSTRPCERCSRKGLQCVDGIRKKAKYLEIIDTHEFDVGSDAHLDAVVAAPSASKMNLNQSADSNNNANSGTQIMPLQLDLSHHMPDTSHLMPLSGSNTVTSAQNAQSQMQPSQQFGGFGSESINSEYSFLSNMLDSSNAHATHLHLHSHQSLDPALLPPHQQAQPTGVVLDMQRSDLLVKKAKRVYRDVVRPYDYREGYHYLVKYIAERMEKPEIMRICGSLAKFRPSFMAVMMNLSEEDLVFMEKCFQRTLIEYEKLITYSGTPTVVWRRSGEICLVGKEFCLLTDWPLETLLPTTPAQQSTYIYQLMDAKSVIEYWDRFATAAFDNTHCSWMVRSVLVSPTGKQIACSVCFTIKRDIFDVPLAIIGNFLPLFQPRKDVSQ
ncbi:Transcriptional regulator of nonfermentable carbon utilization [Chytriomyces hyalinus]|nr:Transcriptional regulator of nonfermentable carbon utilization [Chytriomyces hyalinus]